MNTPSIAPTTTESKPQSQVSLTVDAINHINAEFADAALEDLSLDNIPEFDYTDCDPSATGPSRADDGPHVTGEQVQRAATGKKTLKDLHAARAADRATATAQVSSTAQQTKRLLDHLHRGGKTMALWRGDEKKSIWHNVDAPNRTIPRNLMRDVDLYFTVNPLRQRPPTSKRGSTNADYIRSQIDYLSGINALFAEFDGKDFVRPNEYAPYLPSDYDKLGRGAQKEARSTAIETAFDADIAKYKARAKALVDGLSCAPSVVTDSGSGYHCYWLLRETVTLTDSNRDDTKRVQSAWVGMVGGDKGAKDLTRIFRLPGTRNHKKRFGDNPPRVDFVVADFDRLYDYADLSEMALAWEKAQQPAEPAQNGHTASNYAYVGTSETGEVRAKFNRKHSVVDILTRNGYTVSHQSGNQTRLARPGRKKHESSVTVYAASGDKPEIAVHYSGNDSLLTDGKGRDAFDLHAHFDHSGDHKAAWEAAKKSLDLWEDRSPLTTAKPITDTETGKELPIDECLRRAKIAIESHTFKRPTHQRAAIGVLQRMARTQSTTVRMSKSLMSDHIGGGDSSAGNAILWSCPRAMELHVERLTWQLERREGALAVALAVGDDVDAMWAKLDKKQRVVIKKRVLAACDGTPAAVYAEYIMDALHDGEGIQIPPSPIAGADFWEEIEIIGTIIIAASVGYFAERRDKIASALATITGGIAEGHMLNLFKLIRAGSDGVSAIYALNSDLLNSESFQRSTCDTTVLCDPLETFTIIDFIGQHMTEDAFARNYIPRDRPAMNENGHHQMDGTRYTTDMSGAMRSDKELDTYGQHAPAFIYYLIHNGPSSYGDAAAHLRISLPTLRKMIKRMSSEMEAADLEPLVEIHKEGRTKFVSIPEDWEQRLARSRPALRQDGMIENRARNHITKRLIKLDDVLGTTDSPNERDILLHATENTGNIEQLIRGENVYDMVEASKELADIEDEIMRMGGRAALDKLREKATAAIEWQTIEPECEITGNNVYGHLSEVVIAGGETGEAAERLLSLSRLEWLTYAERGEVTALADLLGVAHVLDGGVNREDMALAADVLSGKVEATEAHAEPLAQPEPSPVRSVPAMQTPTMFAFNNGVPQ